MAATQQTVRFVAACVGVQPTDAELSCSASTIGTTCQAIAQRSARKEQLLGGANVGTQAEVGCRAPARARSAPQASFLPCLPARTAICQLKLHWACACT